MKLINCNDFNINPNIVIETYISIFKIYLDKLYRNNSKSLQYILDKFNLNIDDLKELVNDITLSSDGFLNLQDNSRDFLLLRYLEYGGQNVKSMHILSNSKKMLYKTLNGRRS